MVALPETIQLGGVSYLLTHILAFETENEFVDYFDIRLYQDLTPSERKKTLKTVYRIARKMTSNKKSKQ